MRKRYSLFSNSDSDKEKKFNDFDNWDPYFKTFYGCN
jgi:hypothetical protein